MAYIRTAVRQNGTLVGGVVNLTVNPRIASTFDSPSQAVVFDLASTGVQVGTYNLVGVDAFGRVVSGSTVAYLTANQSITISGDAAGSGTTAISLTLANTGVVAGTYTKLNVDSKGRVIAGTTLVAADIPNLDAAKITTGTLSISTTGSAASLTTARTIAVAGDITGSAAFDGSANATISATLANSGVTPGTYSNATVVVDGKGRVTAAATGDGGSGGGGGSETFNPFLLMGA
jgi:hypothetical protein